MTMRSAPDAVPARWLLDSGCTSDAADELADTLPTGIRRVRYGEDAPLYRADREPS